MHLNKRGWGLKEMIILSGILALFLVIAIYYIVSLYNDFDMGLNVRDYYDLEDKLEGQALIYLNDYYDEVLTSDEVTITRGILNVYNLDTTLIDADGNTCSGYVVASKTKGNIETKGYINCKNYTTDGYQEWRE